ncbi:MAG: nicotinate-nucleotide diphosphorylase (carboxylating), partial [Pseudomonadota bacterium]
MTFPLPTALYLPLIDKALSEDLGEAGDITSLATIPADRQAVATLNARGAGVAAGLPLAAAVFTRVDKDVEVQIHAHDGGALSATLPLLTANGPARSLLTAERTAL